MARLTVEIPLRGHDAPSFPSIFAPFLYVLYWKYLIEEVFELLEYGLFCG